MRFASCLAGVVMLLLPLAGCDSTQPTQVEVSLASLEVSAVGSLVVTFDVWDYIIDNDHDGLPDDGVTYLWCEKSPQNLPPRTLPWTFSIAITVIPAGTADRIPMTSDAARSDQYNVALYDNVTELRGGLIPAIPPRFNNGTPPDAVDNVVTIDDQNYRFVQFSERRNPSVNYDVMHALINPLAEDMGSDPTELGDGICSVGNPGESRIDDLAFPYTLSLNKGDTLIFEARIADDPPAGTGLSEVTAPPGLDPSAIRIDMTVDGREVSVLGVSSGVAVSFSYTAR